MSLVRILSPEPVIGVWPSLHRDMGKKRFDFADLDLIFKVTPALESQILTKKAYLVNQMMDSGQTSMYCIIRIIKRID